MNVLPFKSQVLLEMLKKDYIESGYMYSGSWPYDSLLERGFEKEDIKTLLEAGLIQKRNCDDLAYELTASERNKLIQSKALCSHWFEKTGEGLLTEIQEEVKNASGIIEDKGAVTVDTLKIKDDLTEPNKIRVHCPFSIGQIIEIDYDAKQTDKIRAGYAGYTYAGQRKATGRFIVTDIMHNLLVYPRMNMIGLQSLDDDFNRMYPQERHMLIFEDVVQRRIKVPSLENMIQSATASNPNPGLPDRKESGLAAETVR